MNWKQVGINLLVMAFVYGVGYISSYFFSKRYAVKKQEKEKNNKDQLVQCMDICYRSAKVSDYKEIYYVSCYSWDETYRGYMPDEYLDDRINNFDTHSLRTKNYLEKLFNDGILDTYLVCEVDGVIVGICQYSKSKNEKYLDSGLLGALYVLKKYQGYGIGKKLFEMAVEGIVELGYNSMYLECLTGNKTINFYKKYGGTVVENIDYNISDFSVKADILFYDDLNNVKKLIK